MAGKTLPECLSIVICDAIYRDEGSKKLIIVGTFNRIQPLELPFPHRMSVLFTLTDGQGRYELKLSIQHAETGVELMEVKGPFVMDNPLQIADFNVELNNVVLPETGKYWVCLSVDGTLIKQRPFVVEKAVNQHADP